MPAVLDVQRMQVVALGQPVELRIERVGDVVPFEAHKISMQSP